MTSNVQSVSLSNGTNTTTPVAAVPTQRDTTDAKVASLLLNLRGPPLKPPRSFPKNPKPFPRPAPVVRPPSPPRVAVIAPEPPPPSLHSTPAPIARTIGQPYDPFELSSYEDDDRHAPRGALAPPRKPSQPVQHSSSSSSSSSSSISLPFDLKRDVCDPIKAATMILETRGKQFKAGQKTLEEIVPSKLTSLALIKPLLSKIYDNKDTPEVRELLTQFSLAYDSIVKAQIEKNRQNHRRVQVNCFAQDCPELGALLQIAPSMGPLKDDLKILVRQMTFERDRIVALERSREKNKSTGKTLHQKSAILIRFDKYISQIKKHIRDAEVYHSVVQFMVCYNEISDSQNEINRLGTGYVKAHLFGESRASFVEEIMEILPGEKRKHFFDSATISPRHAALDANPEKGEFVSLHNELEKLVTRMEKAAAQIDTDEEPTLPVLGHKKLDIFYELVKIKNTIWKHRANKEICDLLKKFVFAINKIADRQQLAEQQTKIHHPYFSQLCTGTRRKESQPNCPELLVLIRNCDHFAEQTKTKMCRTAPIGVGNQFEVKQFSRELEVIVGSVEEFAKRTLNQNEEAQKTLRNTIKGAKLKKAREFIDKFTNKFNLAPNPLIFERLIRFLEAYHTISAWQMIKRGVRGPGVAVFPFKESFDDFCKEIKFHLTPSQQGQLKALLDRHLVPTTKNARTVLGQLTVIGVELKSLYEQRDTLPRERIPQRKKRIILMINNKSKEIAKEIDDSDVFEAIKQVKRFFDKISKWQIDLSGQGNYFADACETFLDEIKPHREKYKILASNPRDKDGRGNRRIGRKRGRPIELLDAPPAATSSSVDARPPSSDDDSNMEIVEVAADSRPPSPPPVPALKRARRLTWNPPEPTDSIEITKENATPFPLEIEHSPALTAPTPEASGPAPMVQVEKENEPVLPLEMELSSSLTAPRPEMSEPAPTVQVGTAPPVVPPAPSRKELLGKLGGLIANMRKLTKP